MNHVVCHASCLQDSILISGSFNMFQAFNPCRLQLWLRHINEKGEVKNDTDTDT